MRATLFFSVLSGALIGCEEPFAEDDPERGRRVATMAATPACGEGWGRLADSFAGIDGSFERAGPAPIGEMKALALLAVEDPRARVVSEANAVHVRECGRASCPVETARASMLPEGTAMTPMLLFSANGFNRADPDMRGFYDVLGIERDDWGMITALCLQRIDTPRIGEPFIMSRAADAAR
jgi:hypothetical protein